MHPAVLAAGPWNGSRHEYRPYARVSGASRAFTCAIAAGRASADAEHPTLNPRVRGSSPWRRTRRSSRLTCTYLHVWVRHFRRGLPVVGPGWFEAGWGAGCGAGCLADAAGRAGCCAFRAVVWVVWAAMPLMVAVGCRWLWRRCGGGEAGAGLAAPAAGPGREAGCGAAGVVGLAGVPGGQDALVADGEQAGEPEHQRGQAHQAGPAAGDVVAGRVFGGGEGSLGAGAPGVGLAVLLGGVVVFLPGFGGRVWRDGDGLLLAAGGRVSGRGEDLGPVAV